MNFPAPFRVWIGRPKGIGSCSLCLLGDADAIADDVAGAEYVVAIDHIR